MVRRFEIGESVALEAEGWGASAMTTLERGLDPCRPATSPLPALPALRLRASPELGERPLVEIQGDAGDGLLSARDADGPIVLSLGERCRLPTAPAPGGTTTLEHTPGFPAWELLREIALPALAGQLAAAGALCVHSAAVELDGDATLICGWSESGKTEVALALAEAGASVVADKWTAIDATGRVHPFPASVGVRSWVLSYLPKLRASLRPPARLRLAAGGSIERAGQSLTRAWSGPVSGAARAPLLRAAGLGSRLSIPLSRLPDVYGKPRPAAVSRVVVLRTVEAGPPQAAALAPDIAARRIALSNRYERRRFHALHERDRYAAAGASVESTGRIDTEAAELELLTPLLGTREVVELRVPFPADPRAAAAVLRQL